jgi:hypothetical protein
MTHIAIAIVSIITAAGGVYLLLRRRDATPAAPKGERQGGGPSKPEQL